MNRRKLLATGLAATVAGVAGCLGDTSRSAREEHPVQKSSDEIDRVGSPMTQFQHDARNSGSVREAVPKAYETRWEIELSPVDAGLSVADERVVVAAQDEGIVALDALTGDRLWTADVGVGVGGPPALTDAVAFVTVWNGTEHQEKGVVALDIEDGTELWRTLPGYHASTAPTLTRETLFVTGYLREGGGRTGVATALSPSTGDVRWNQEIDASAPAPAVTGDNLCILASGRERAITAIDVDDWSRRWQHQVDDRVTVAPTTVDNAVYVGTKGGSVHALSSSDGEEQWRVDVGSSVQDSLAVRGGSIYVPTADGIVALDEDGARKWLYPTANDGVEAPTITDETLVSADTGVFCVSLSDGAERWRHRVSDRSTGDMIFTGVRCSPVVDDGVVYGASHGGTVFALGRRN